MDPPPCMQETGRIYPGVFVDGHAVVEVEPARAQDLTVALEPVELEQVRRRHQLKPTR